MTRMDDIDEQLKFRRGGKPVPAQVAVTTRAVMFEAMTAVSIVTFIAALAASFS
jgi:hypothetical protein